MRQLERGQSNLAIVDLLPGGSKWCSRRRWNRPIPARRATIAAAGSRRWPPPAPLWAPDYSDIREDRVIIYGSAGTEVQEFVYQIKATNTGS